jgi:osmotically-inducible protein OsmY
MGKRKSSLILLLFLGLASLGGCSRQDRECLSGIGRKLIERAGSATASYREKLDGLKSSRDGDDNLQDRVSLRLRWEKVLADTAIQVVASGNEIELKGTVKNIEQRARATELAESTAGVDRVLVSLTVGEEKKDE